MFLITKLRAFLQKHKKELLLTLLAAGCASIGYFILRDKSIYLNPITLQKMIHHHVVNEVILQGSDIQFKTSLSQWFKVDTKGLSMTEIQNIIQGAHIIKMEDFSLLEKYKEVVYGVASLAGIMLCKAGYDVCKTIPKVTIPKAKKLSSLKKKLVKLTKIDHIPRIFQRMKSTLIVNILDSEFVKQISSKTKKNVISLSVSSDLIRCKQMEISNSIVLIKSIDLSKENNKIAFEGVLSKLNKGGNILILIGNQVEEVDMVQSCLKFNNMTKPNEFSNLAKSTPATTDQFFINFKDVCRKLKQMAFLAK